MGRERVSSEPTGSKRRSDAELLRAEVSSSGEEEPPCVGSGVLVTVMFGKDAEFRIGITKGSWWQDERLPRDGRRAGQEGDVGS